MFFGAVQVILMAALDPVIIRVCSGALPHYSEAEGLMLVAEEAVEIRRLRRPGFDGTETRACTRDLRSCVDRESVSVSGGAIARIRQNLSAGFCQVHLRRFWSRLSGSEYCQQGCRSPVRTTSRLSMNPQGAGATEVLAGTAISLEHRYQTRR
jgi:hypothetical protein